MFDIIIGMFLKNIQAVLGVGGALGGCLVVFAFPSHYEGMPLSIIEVQANGLPCILSKGVPQDVYLTDLIHPLDLANHSAWIRKICESKRGCPEQYADMLKDSGFDTQSAMKKIYDIYERIS